MSGELLWFTVEQKQESAEREAHARDEEIRQKISRLNQALVNDLRPGEQVDPDGIWEMFVGMRFRRQ